MNQVIGDREPLGGGVALRARGAQLAEERHVARLLHLCVGVRV